MNIFPDSAIVPLMWIDRMLKALAPNEATGQLIDAYIRAHVFNLSDFERHPEFVVALVTHNEQLWRNILKASDWQCWLHDEGTGLAIYEPDATCGATTIYQWTPGPGQRRRFPSPQPNDYAWKRFDSESKLLTFLRESTRPERYSKWLINQQEILAIPTELAEGRLANTTVEKAMIYSRGDGCVFCGAAAPGYAGTTICDGKLFLQLPTCPTHLKDAKAAPTVLSVLAELLHAQIDIPQLQKYEHIPDDYIVPIIKFLGGKLAATASQPERRPNGWHTVLTRASGWRLVLRLRALHDYAYMLLDPSKKERHRIDSAPDHPDVPFGPSHQHARPGTKKERISPSFTYGIPLFDFVMLDELIARYEQGQL